MFRIEKKIEGCRVVEVQHQNWNQPLINYTS